MYIYTLVGKGHSKDTSRSLVYVYVYVYIRAYVYVYVYIRVYVYVYVHIYIGGNRCSKDTYLIHTHTKLKKKKIHTDTHTHIHTRAHTRTHARTTPLPRACPPHPHTHICTRRNAVQNGNQKRPKARLVPFLLRKFPSATSSETLPFIFRISKNLFSEFVRTLSPECLCTLFCQNLHRNECDPFSIT